MINSLPVNSSQKDANYWSLLSRKFLCPDKIYKLPGITNQETTGNDLKILLALDSMPLKFQLPRKD